MADEIVFYTHPMSRGRMVRWMLEEVGAPYRTEILGYGTSMKSPAFLAINPMGKVPALVHGQTVVTECAAIIAYLADAYPAAGLAPPADSRLRGSYYRWLFYGAGPIEAALVNAALQVEVSEKQRGMVGYGSLRLVLDTLEAAFAESEYLAGDRFSAADLYVGSQIAWGMMFGTIEKRPAFEAYVARGAARPAAMRAREIDDMLVAEAQHAPA